MNIRQKCTMKREGGNVPGNLTYNIPIIGNLNLGIFIGYSLKLPVDHRLRMILWLTKFSHYSPKVNCGTEIEGRMFPQTACTEHQEQKPGK